MSGREIGLLLGLWVGWFGWVDAALGQAADPTAALSGMAEQAGVIFAGHVAAVTHHDVDGYVEVRFGVDEAARGFSTGTDYVLREWVGLWLGFERYRKGQRLLMLLYAPGSSGLSGPVGGLDGAIPLSGMGDAPVLGSGGKVAADVGGSGSSVDLRWVQASWLKAMTKSMPVTPVKPLVPVAQAAITSGAVGRPVVAAGPAALPTVASLDAVMTFLRGVGGAR